MELSTPLTGPSANTANDMAAMVIMGCAFFDADPTDPDAGLVAFQAFPGPWGTLTVPPYATSETGIATHIVVEVYDPSFSFPVPAVLQVNGTPYDEEDPPPPGVDLQFLWPIPNGDPEDPETHDTSLGAWPSDQDAIDPVFQGYSQAEERGPYFLEKMNSGGDQLSMDGTFHLGVRPLQRYTFPVQDEAGSTVNASYKVWDIGWDFHSIQTQLSLVRQGEAG